MGSFQRFSYTILLLASSISAQANMLETLTGVDINQTELLQKNNIYFSGWISGGASYNTDSPDHHNNSPVTFNDRNAEFQLNQINIAVEKMLDMESEQWDFGGRLDVLFGTDGRFTQASGLDDELISEENLRFYDLALPQAYLEIYAPFGNGISAKLGHFYTIIGYEVVTAPDNFFYSHAITMQYAEPFTHTGLLINYPISSNITVNFGAVNGWDNFDENLANWNFLGNIAWSSEDEDSSVVWSVITGDVDDVTSENRSMYSLVVTHNFSAELHYIFQHDFGFQEQADANGDDAYWYGINQYLFYDYNDSLSFGLRAEWFRDDGDSRLAMGSSGSYYAISGGINWSPIEWIKIRPEVRYDWVDSDSHVYDQQTEDNQLLFSMDLVLEL